MHHYVDDAALIRAAQSAFPKPQEKKIVAAALERWLGRQPVAPALVGAKRAAEILGIPAPHISRLRERGRLPEPLAVEGGFDVYIREEIEELAIVLKNERSARARKRAEREEAAE